MNTAGASTVWRFAWFDRINSFSETRVHQRQLAVFRGMSPL